MFGWPGMSPTSQIIIPVAWSLFRVNCEVRVGMPSLQKTYSLLKKMCIHQITNQPCIYLEPEKCYEESLQVLRRGTILSRSWLTTLHLLSSRTSTKGEEYDNHTSFLFLIQPNRNQCISSPCSLDWEIMWDSFRPLGDHFENCTWIHTHTNTPT